ncbi:MAG: hypothetical protein WBO46_05140 [Caldilineaceae bacterium]
MSCARKMGGLMLAVFALVGCAWLWIGGPYAPGPAEAGIGVVLAREIEHSAVSTASGQPVSTTQLSGIEAGPAFSAVQLTVAQSRFLGSQAMVSVRVVDAARPLAYRESRFYEESTAGWQRIPPIPAFWGRGQTASSQFFDFHYRRLDSLAVQEAASVLDTRYVALRRAFGLSLPTAGENIRVEVGLDSVYGDRTQQRMRLRSPLLLPVPEPLTDGDMLVQSAQFVLVDWTISEALRSQTAAGAMQLSMPMLNGLRLWGHWQVGGPLAKNRVALMRAAFSPGTEAANEIASICQVLKGWQMEVQSASVGVVCPLSNDIVPGSVAEPTRLDKMPDVCTLSPDAAEAAAIDPGLSPIVLATLLDYAAETFGPGRLPLLLGSASVTCSWEALIPAVFDIPVREFALGWRVWLEEEYGL